MAAAGSPIRSLDHLAWPAVECAAARPGSTVIWPIGAIEQHGPHLPLGTDGLFADRVLDAVLKRLPPELPIWRLPLATPGFSPEHRGFPGTLSLGADLLIAQVKAVGRDLASAGFERLVLFNGHGGQIALLQVAARELRELEPRLGVFPTFLWSGAEGLASLVPASEWEHGLHAGLLETSLMLHLAPELVGDVRPSGGQLDPPAPAGWSLEGALPTAWFTRDLSSNGVIGDPGEADARLGAEVCERLVQGWCLRLQALLASDWPPRHDT
jgi:creatinine amidohydrolase